MIQPTTRSDPMAIACVFALLGLAFFAQFAHIGPPQAEAQDIRIIDATATPPLPTMALAPLMVEKAQPTPAPPQALQDAPGATEGTAPVNFPVAPQIAPQIAAQEAAPTIDPAVLQATEDARVQAAIDAALNDPQQNGGNVAPQGCPFPIINGVCANGVLARTVGDSAFGSKSIADQAGPAHQTKGQP